MDDRLKTLYDYTKFHIGMYATLIAAIVGLFSNGDVAGHYRGFLPFVESTVVFFVVAGAAGGLVASSIPACSDYESFIQSRLGPWNLRLISATVCIHIEHSAFWLGILTSVAGLLRQNSTLLQHAAFWFVHRTS